MTAGLAGLLYALSPSAGRSDSVPWYVWLTGIGINLAVLAVVSGLVMTGAVVMLARSPLLSQNPGVSSPARREAPSSAIT